MYCIKVFSCNKTFMYFYRGLLSRSILQAQGASPIFTHVYAALVAIINSKFPNIGELILKRLILNFRKGYRRNDKVCKMSRSSILIYSSSVLNFYRVHSNDVLGRNAAETCGLGPIIIFDLTCWLNISTWSTVVLEYHESLTTYFMLELWCFLFENM